MAKRSTVRKTRQPWWPWLIGGGAVAALFGVVVIALMPAAKPDDARTVRDVLSGAEIVHDGPPINDKNSALTELARAMGLPQGALSSEAPERAADAEATRDNLVTNLESARNRGQITAEEASAVLKAYDTGLVDAPIEAVKITDSDQ